MLNIKLQNLPPYGKLFVGLITALMLCVCLWAVFIYYVSNGIVDENTAPDYWQTNGDNAYKEQVFQDAEEVVEDTLSEPAPDWDSDFTDESVKVQNPESLAQKFMASDEEHQAFLKWKRHLRHNVGLAHTHINGQTLLFFVLGFIFLFTSAKPKIKKTVFWIFGVAILCHAIGLSGQGFHWFFDDILILSGLALLVVMPYMSLLIFVDLSKKPESTSE